jgi:DNA-binding FadR family transcriptional regulator
VNANDATLDTLFASLEAPTVVEQTIRRLTAVIKFGLLPPGGRLPAERDLANQLDISRTTLRQALSALTETGYLLASRGHGGGTFVADPLPVAGRKRTLTDTELRALLDYRLAIESAAVIRATERGSESEFLPLYDLIDEMDEKDELEAWRQVDARFHLGLAAAAHSSRLIAEMADVHGRIHELVVSIPLRSAIVERTSVEHRQIVDRLVQGDASGALEVLRRHLTAADNYFLTLSSMNRDEPGPDGTDGEIAPLGD